MLPLIVCLPFLGALLVPVAARQFGTKPALTASLAAGLALILLITQMPPIYDGQVLIDSHQWIPAIGLSASFRLDGLSLLFAQLILIIGMLVLLYAHYYLSASEGGPRFYSFLLLFMGAMLGLVLSENLLQMLLFWELTSLSSFLLIGFRRHEAEARQGARLALLITGGGGLALLASVLILGHLVGSYELTDVLAAGETIKQHRLYPLILVLFLLGAGTKSAQFPFHFWLPHAMSAPTPVSAYLHSATMVKAGIFLLGRFFPVLSGTDLWFYTVGTAGAITLLLGAYLALFQNDLKGLLAYSTISHLGLITLLFGLGTPLGEIAAVFHIINHAVFKASLFMAAGIIDHECGSRDMRKVNGLFKYMPYTAVLAMVAASAMAGVPLLNGFLSKEMFFGETVYLQWLGEASWHWLLPFAATVAGVLAVAYSLRFIHDVFFNGEPKGLTKTPHEPPRWMKVPVEILVVLCVAVGTFPGITVRPALEAAAGAVLQRPLPEFSLSIWHGFTYPLLMSLIALGGGVLLYALRRRVFAAHDRIPFRVRGKALADGLIAWTFRAGTWLDGLIDNRSLPRYMFLLLLCSLALGVAGYWGEPIAGPAAGTPIGMGILIGGILLGAGSVATAVWHRSRFRAVLDARTGGADRVPFVRALLRAGPGPDPAPDRDRHRGPGPARHALSATRDASGVEPAPPRARRLARPSGGHRHGGCSATPCSRTPPTSISAFHLAESKPGGGGTNVVNVTLVDFRGFDTLGEVTVLGIAAIGILGMLTGLFFRGPDTDLLGHPWSRDRHPLILSTVSKLLLPMALLVAAWLFLRGHNEPGGGFIAGLVAGVALILQYIAEGTQYTHRRMDWNLPRLIGTGILIAALTGLVSWLFGYPFLTSSYSYVTLPLIGTFELASAMVFDLGVFLGVVGTVLLILSGIGRLHLQEGQG